MPSATAIKLFGTTITPLQPEIEPSNSGDTVPDKKPDTILPCPRCKSTETKFCYFNNYNVNQPRHFCKACQRYWTAGGALRNVPVGAGRRKTKPPCHSLVASSPDVRFFDVAGLNGLDPFSRQVLQELHYPPAAFAIKRPRN